MPTLASNVLAVATQVPPTAFTQQDMSALLGVAGDKHLRFFQHPHVERRHFIAPEKLVSPWQAETTGELRDKFRQHAPALAGQAVRRALLKAEVKLSEVRCLVCVSTSGFFTPGLSAWLAEEMGLAGVARLDVVGMGCQAGMNGLQALHNWCQTHPTEVGVLVCCELNSCIYDLAASDNNALVNSLFGDGVAALVMAAGVKAPAPHIVDFASHLIPGTLEALAFRWEEERARYSFQIDKRTPALLGGAVRAPLEAFLSRHQLTIGQVDQWVVHGGGEAILGAIQGELALSDEALRHTRSVLRDFGNVASGSFLFSYQRLLEENRPMAGKPSVLMSMGPGLSLELALLRW